MAFSRHSFTMRALPPHTTRTLTCPLTSPLPTAFRLTPSAEPRVYTISMSTPLSLKFPRACRPQPPLRLAQNAGHARRKQRGVRRTEGQAGSKRGVIVAAASLSEPKSMPNAPSLTVHA